MDDQHLLQNSRRNLRTLAQLEHSSMGRDPVGSRECDEQADTGADYVLLERLPCARSRRCWFRERQP